MDPVFGPMGLKIKEILEKYLNYEEIHGAAINSGFVLRDRKTDPVVLLLTLVLGKFSQEKPSIAKYNRLYNSTVDEANTIEYNSFYARFDECCLRFINECV